MIISKTKLVIAFSFGIFVTLIATAQPSQLIYLKTFPAAFGRLNYLKSDSSYIFSEVNFGTTFDASVWQNDGENTISPTLGQSVLIYDSDFHFQSYFETVYSNSDIRPLVHSDSNWLFNVSQSYDFTGEYHTNPVVTGDYPPIIYGASHILRFDEAENTMQMPFHCDCYIPGNFNSGSPFSGFHQAADAEGQLFLNRNSGAAMADGTIIRTLYLFHDIFLNWEDTIPIDENYWGTVWVKQNIATGNIIVSNMASPNGSALSHAMFSSEDHQFIYRTGVVRGNNVQISPDGTTWTTDPQDSLYYAFIVKENANGEQEWMNELYGYSSTSPLEDKGISAEMESLGLVEIDESVFLSQSVKISNPLADSLLFREFDGSEHLLYNPPLDSLGGIQLGYAANTIFKFNQNGEKVLTLNNILALNDISAYQNNFQAQLPILNKVGNKLAWLHKYNAQNDTTVYFFKSQISGNVDTLIINLPAGRASYVLWMDSNLNILENFIIPYTAPNISLGLNLTAIFLPNPDTLIISGYLAPNTSTSLDPTGQSSQIAYGAFTSFIGFYTVPEVLGVVEPSLGLNIEHHIDVFPNPTSGIINIAEVPNISGKYSIYNTIGRVVKSGAFQSDGILHFDVSNLNAGVYIINLISREQKLTGRFVIL